MDTPKEATLEEQIQFCLVLKFAMASDHFNGDNILDKKWQDVAATVASRDAGLGTAASDIPQVQIFTNLDSSAPLGNPGLGIVNCSKMNSNSSFGIRNWALNSLGSMRE